MVAIVEAAFRRAWLEITYGATHTRTVNLGAKPVSIGSNASKCPIYVSGAVPIALRYWMKEDHIFCEDIVKEKPLPVKERLQAALSAPWKSSSEPAAGNNPQSHLNKSSSILDRPHATHPPSARTASAAFPRPENHAQGKPEGSTAQSSATVGVQLEVGICPTCQQKILGIPGQRRCARCLQMF